MTPVERGSLRLRLLLWLLPPIMLLTAVWIWATYAIVLNFANLAYDRALTDTAQTLAGQLRANNGRVDVALSPEAREMLEFDPVDLVFFSVSDLAGQQLVGNQTLPPHPAGPGVARAIRHYDGRLDGLQLRLVEYTVAAGTPGGLLSVRVAETLKKREILAREVLSYMIVPQLLFLGGIVLLLWYGVGRGIAPLARIRDAIARRSHEDLSPLDERGLPAEVREQVHVINALMQRLGQTITAQRRFIADATHQLRTPITVLRTQTELALRARDAGEQAAMLDKLDAGSARLARMANQLLNLSRAEAGGANAREPTPIAPADLVEDVAAGLVPAALAKGIDVRVDTAANLPALRADRQLLAEMLANLVDNAIRYTQPGGQIDIRASHQAGQLILTVTDNGPGIPEAERQRVFERFYRGVDAASEGSGLGLAIAREIAQLHEGTITLAPAVDARGLVARVELPV